MTRGRKAQARRLVWAPSEQASLADENADAQSGVETAPEEIKDAARTVRSVPITVLRLLWGLVVVVGSAVGVTWTVYRYATTSPRFALKDIQISGSTRMNRDLLLQSGAIALGNNLFMLNLGAIEKRLLVDPWIRQIHITRRLPSTLQVDIEEREASAIAVLAGHLLLVTRLGETFKEASPADPSDLPTITGVAVDDAPRDLGLERQRLATALDVLKQYAQGKLAGTYPPQEVHLAPGGEVVMTVGRKGIALYMGFGPWSKKFAIAERIFAKLQAQRSTPSLVFLDNRAHPERVVVRVN